MRVSVVSLDRPPRNCNAAVSRVAGTSIGGLQGRPLALVGTRRVFVRWRVGGRLPRRARRVERRAEEKVVVARAAGLLASMRTVRVFSGLGMGQAAL